MKNVAVVGITRGMRTPVDVACMGMGTSIGDASFRKLRKLRS